MSSIHSCSQALTHNTHGKTLTHHCIELPLTLTIHREWPITVFSALVLKLLRCWCRSVCHILPKFSLQGQWPWSLRSTMRSLGFLPHPVINHKQCSERFPWETVNLCTPTPSPVVSSLPAKVTECRAVTMAFLKSHSTLCWRGNRTAIGL